MLGASTIVRRISAVTVLLALSGCSQEHIAEEWAPDTGRLPLPPAVTLMEVGAVIEPDLSEATAWLPPLWHLRAASAGTIVGMSRQGGAAVEFDTAGRFVRRFGAMRGAGPGEIRNLDDIDLNGSAVVLLDRSQSKVVVVSRTGEHRTDFRLPPRTRAIALADGELFVTPGSGDRVFGRYTLEGELIEEFGEARELPFGSIRGRADDCLGCRLHSASDSLLILIDEDRSGIAVFEFDGELKWARDFTEADTLVRSWSRHDRQEIARNQEAAGVHAVVMKTYFLSTSVVDGETLALAVAPAGPAVRATGYEYWLMRIEDGTYERFGFPRTLLGYSATGRDTVFAVDLRNDAIIKLSFP